MSLFGNRLTAQRKLKLQFCSTSLMKDAVKQKCSCVLIAMISSLMPQLAFS